MISFFRHWNGMPRPPLTTSLMRSNEIWGHRATGERNGCYTLGTLSSAFFQSSLSCNIYEWTLWVDELWQVKRLLCRDVWGPRCVSQIFNLLTSDEQRLSFTLSLTHADIFKQYLTQIIISIFKYITVSFEKLSFSGAIEEVAACCLFYLG